MSEFEVVNTYPRGDFDNEQLWVTVAHQCPRRGELIEIEVNTGRFLESKSGVECPDCHGEAVVIKKPGNVYVADSPQLQARV